MSIILWVLFGGAIPAIVALSWCLVHMRRRLVLMEKARCTACDQRDSEIRRRKMDLEVTGELIRDLRDKQGKLERARDHFLESVSHELRTPLASLMAAAEILEGEARELAELHEWMMIIQESAERLQLIVERTEELVRLDTSFPRESLDLIGLDNLVERLSGSIQQLAQDHGVWCKVSWPRSSIVLPASAEHLVRILELLVENAMRFTPAGGRVVVQFDPVLHLDGNDKLLLQVVDRGLGIAIEDLPHIFEPFHQALGEDGEKPEGLGLGLSLCESLAASFGSRIAVRRRTGAGTCFFFELDCFFESADDRLRITSEDMRERLILTTAERVEPPLPKPMKSLPKTPSHKVSGSRF